MPFRTAYAQAETDNTVDNARRAAASIKHELASAPACVVLYFASTRYNPHVLAQEMREAFPDALTLGATDAGEGCDDKLMNNSVVAMAFDPGEFDHCRFGMILGNGQTASPEEGIFSSPEECLAHLARDTGRTVLDLDYREYVGLVLVECLTPYSESLIHRVGELTNVIFVGGVAGDDDKHQNEQVVFYNGKPYKNAAVMGLMKPKNGFGLAKTQAVELTGQVMTVTRADEEKRIVWELDNQPASEVYARLANVQPDATDNYHFATFPLALVADGEPFLRAAIQQVEGGGLLMFCTVKEGMRLAVTRSGDVIGTTAAALERKRAELGGINGIIHVNCTARHGILRRTGKEAEFAKLFRGIPVISFSSYGEIYIGPVSMTSTMILFR